jgi:hypothetical protein
MSVAGSCRLGEPRVSVGHRGTRSLERHQHRRPGTIGMRWPHVPTRRWHLRLSAHRCARGSAPRIYLWAHHRRPAAVPTLGRIGGLTNTPTCPRRCSPGSCSSPPIRHEVTPVGPRPARPPPAERRGSPLLAPFRRRLSRSRHPRAVSRQRTVSGSTGAWGHGQPMHDVARRCGGHRQQGIRWRRRAAADARGGPP